MQAALEKLRFFLQTFPTLTSLAMASEQEVLKAFSGLGYYRRARNLHKGARFILQKYGADSFPSSYKELIAVPGIGDYTASAILSISFNQPILSVDANIIRIYQRLSLSTAEFNNKTRKEIQQFFAPFFQKNYSYYNGEINEALMQLGQKVCTSKKASCTVCPLQFICFAFLEKKDLNLLTPQKTKIKKEKINVVWHLFVFELNNKKILLTKLNQFYFLDGHYGLPSQLVFDKKDSPKNKSLNDSIGKILFSHQKESFILAKIFQHSITHHRITAQVWLVKENNLPKQLQKKLRQTIEMSSCYKTESIEDAHKFFSSSLFLKALQK